MGLCPHCDAPVGRVTLHEVTASALFANQWRAVTYSCPACQHVLSVQIDPIAIKTDIVDELMRRLGRR